MEISTWTRWKGKENFNLNEQKKRISTLNEQKGEVQLSGSENFSSSDWNGKFKENRIEAYLYIKERENEIFYSQWKRKIQSLQDWEMCSYVLSINATRKVVYLNVDKKQDWKMKSFSISYLIFTGFWKMVTGHSKTLLWENESHVWMKIIVLSLKFSADLLLLMFVWEETGSAKKKTCFTCIVLYILIIRLSQGKELCRAFDA